MPAVATDNFNRADGSLGSNWTDQEPGSAIASNEVTGSGGDGGFNHAYWNADAFDDDQYAQIVIKTTGTYIGPSVRCSGLNKAYLLQTTGSGSTLFKWDTGFTNLGSYGAVSANDVVKLEVTGTTLKVYINGAQNGSNATDSGLASGSAGIYTAGTTARADDWEGGNVGGGGGATAIPVLVGGRLVGGILGRGLVH
jgi:hypothetical protein